MFESYTFQCSTINDREDYRSVMNAMKTMGFGFDQAEALWKVLSAVLNLVRYMYGLWK